jgi:hypothetical protein
MDRFMLRGTSHEHLLAELHQCELLGDSRSRNALRSLAEGRQHVPTARRSFIGRLFRLGETG